MKTTSQIISLDVGTELTHLRLQFCREIEECMMGGQFNKINCVYTYTKNLVFLTTFTFLTLDFIILQNYQILFSKKL